MKLPVVSDFMETDVHTLTADTPMLDAVAFLLDHQVTGAPVVNADHQVIGIISEKDCLRLLALGVDVGEKPRGTVADYMTTEVVTVPATMNIYFVAGMFLNDHVRRFPVVAARSSRRLVGAITRFDILRAIRSNRT